MSPLSDLTAFLLGLFRVSTTANDKVISPVSYTGVTPTSHYRLDNDSSAIFTLPDGRKLGYAQYGSPTGRPVLYQHGHPGSRIEAAMFHQLGLDLGARIIAIDRPGFGWSSPQPDRKLLDLPKDLAHLTNHLGLEEYAVLGISGGGPYALACAYALPREKLKAVSIVCGKGPYDMGMKGASWVLWLGFAFGYRYAPDFLMPLFWAFWRREPAGRLDLTDEKRLDLVLQSVKAAGHEKDREAIKKDEDLIRLSLRSAREGFAQGYGWCVQDGRVMCRDFGFRIEDIRPDLPVQLWYGKYDTNVPLNHGEQTAVRLGGRAQLNVKDDTHTSIVINWKKEILEDLVKSM